MRISALPFVVAAARLSAASRMEAAKLVGGFLGLDKARERADGAGKLTLIGAGFSRTGTKSTEAALLELGHKIYDTRSILENNHADRWVDAAERLKRGDDGAVAALLAEMEAAGYTATLDFPMNLFGHSLAALRPDAKILFTTRNLDAWFASWYAVNDVLGIFVLRPWSWLVDFKFTEPICQAFGFDMIVARYPDHVRRPLPWFERLKTLPSLDPPGSKERWIAFYERTRDALERDYPDRFLAFDVKAVCVRRADTPRTGRGDAGGRDADIPRRRFAAPPRLRAGYSFRRRAAATTPRVPRGKSERGRRADDGARAPRERESADG